MNGLITSENTGEDGKVVIIDDTGVVLVDGHHQSHRGTEQRYLSIWSIADQSTLQHQMPCCIQCARQAIEAQLYLSTWRFNQDCESCNDSVEKVPIIILCQ